MRTGLIALRALTATAIALAVLMPSGCGDAGAGAEGSAPAISHAYVEMVTHLKEAALSNQPYGAARRARGLAKPELALIAGFCRFAWQVPVNHLVYLLDEHEYVVGRVTHLAELRYRGGAVDYDIGDASIEALLGKLRRIVHLRSLDGSLVRRYSRACYRQNPPAIQGSASS